MIYRYDLPSPSTAGKYEFIDKETYIKKILRINYSKFRHISAGKSILDIPYNELSLENQYIIHLSENRCRCIKCKHIAQVHEVIDMDVPNIIRWKYQCMSCGNIEYIYDVNNKVMSLKKEATSLITLVFIPLANKKFMDRAMERVPIVLQTINGELKQLNRKWKNINWKEVYNGN